MTYRTAAALIQTTIQSSQVLPATLTPRNSAHATHQLISKTFISCQTGSDQSRNPLPLFTGIIQYKTNGIACSRKFIYNSWFVYEPTACSAGNGTVTALEEPENIKANCSVLHETLNFQ